ncbi:hypothetical protein SSP24_81960 [Streptomyces spinoverrucosus]|uniref:Uncharacterized protein n=1 Tax=Streptomyces spinoverrucosus TaxID=284043 RepID=A0A4Y3VXN5_9ACTN|nr:hypothetical protein SSP24_81960 [Streptomyces spinoverrucosus]GHB98846.1 hypothetical protein GCM10010397_84000 [Streptomyces spinoverrucosus]
MVRKVAIARGAVLVRTREASSAKVASRMWWRASMCQCPRISSASRTGAALLGGEAGDCVDRRDGGLPGSPAGAAALDLDRLDGVWEVQAGMDSADLQAADLVPVVGLAAGTVLERDLARGQVSQPAAEVLLVALDDEDAVAALGSDLLGVTGLGVHRIGSDDQAVQVQPVQQRGGGGDLVALGGDLPLADDGLGLVQDGGQEMDGSAFTVTAAAYGLAVDSQASQRRRIVLDRVGGMAGEPGAHGVIEGVAVDPGQQLAQGGGVPKAFQPEPGPHVGVRVRGEPCDDGQGGGPAQNREDAQREQRAQPVAASPHPSRLGQTIQNLPQRDEFRQAGMRAGHVGVPEVALQDTGQGR